MKLAESWTNERKSLAVFSQRAFEPLELADRLLDARHGLCKAPWERSWA
jgi:hypothetical protein